MARVIETTIYSFDELSEEAKEFARDNFRNDGDLWGWQCEWWNSAQAFSKIAPIRITSADYDRADVDIEWTDDDAIADLSGLRAWKWLQNNYWFKWAANEKQGACTLTGYCGDCSFADTFAEYEKNPLSVPDLKQVFYESAQEWVQQARSDMEYSHSDEAIDSLIECNEYEFTELGELI